MTNGLSRGVISYKATQRMEVGDFVHYIQLGGKTGYIVGPPEDSEGIITKKLTDISIFARWGPQGTLLTYEEEE